MPLLRFSPLLQNRLIRYQPNWLMIPEQAIVALDFEFDHKRQINEIGAILFTGEEVKDCFHAVLPCGRLYLDGMKSLSTLSFLNTIPGSNKQILKLLDFIGDKPILAHNAGVEKGILQKHARDFNLQFKHNPFLCSMNLSSKIRPQLETKQLGKISDCLDIPRAKNFHRALNDAHATFELWLAMRRELRSKYRLSPEYHFEFLSFIAKLPTAHAHDLLKYHTGRELLLAARKEYKVKALLDKFKKIRKPV